MKDSSKEKEANGSLIGGLGKFLKLITEMEKNDVEELSVKGAINNNDESKVTGTYGVNIKLGIGKDKSLQEDMRRIVGYSSSRKALNSPAEHTENTLEDSKEENK
jgi:hypothetical protein